jgi:hypothetical protein
MLGSTINPLIPQISSKDNRIIQAEGIDKDALK